MVMTAPTTLTKTDREALQLAVDLTRADPQRTEQVASMLEQDGWWETARSCSYHQQCETLDLCSEVTPADVEDADEMLAGPTDCAWFYGAHEAARLVKLMQALGISQFHPDPIAAIAAAENLREAEMTTYAQWLRERRRAAERRERSKSFAGQSPGRVTPQVSSAQATADAADGDAGRVPDRAARSSWQQRAGFQLHHAADRRGADERTRAGAACVGQSRRHGTERMKKPGDAAERTRRTQPRSTRCRARVDGGRPF